MNDRIESIIACLWGSFLGLLLGGIVALFCMVGCSPASEGVVIDEAFVMCVCLQQQLAVKETPAELEDDASLLKPAAIIATYGDSYSSQLSITASKAGDSNGSAEIASLPRPASETAVTTKAEPLILFGYPGCEACSWIRKQFDARGVKYTYRSVAPVAGVTYPHATQAGKHLNYTELKELVK